jgi:hypothetical protein
VANFLSILRSLTSFLLLGWAITVYSIVISFMPNSNRRILKIIMTIERNLELQQEAREELQWSEENGDAEWGYCQRQRLVILNGLIPKSMKQEATV